MIRFYPITDPRRWGIRGIGRWKRGSGGCGIRYRDVFRRLEGTIREAEILVDSEEGKGRGKEGAKMIEGSVNSFISALPSLNRGRSAVTIAGGTN